MTWLRESRRGGGGQISQTRKAKTQKTVREALRAQRKASRGQRAEAINILRREYHCFFVRTMCRCVTPGKKQKQIPVGSWINLYFTVLSNLFFLNKDFSYGVASE